MEGAINNYELQCKAVQKHMKHTNPCSRLKTTTPSDFFKTSSKSDLFFSPLPGIRPKQARIAQKKQSGQTSPCYQIRAPNGEQEGSKKRKQLCGQFFYGDTGIMGCNNKDYIFRCPTPGPIQSLLEDLKELYGFSKHDRFPILFHSQQMPSSLANSACTLYAFSVNYLISIYSPRSSQCENPVNSAFYTIYHL